MTGHDSDQGVCLGDPCPRSSDVVSLHRSCLPPISVVAPVLSDARRDSDPVTHFAAVQRITEDIDNCSKERCDESRDWIRGGIFHLRHGLGEDGSGTACEGRGGGALHQQARTFPLNTF